MRRELEIVVAEFSLVLEVKLAVRVGNVIRLPRRMTRLELIRKLLVILILSLFVQFVLLFLPALEMVN